MTDDEIRAVDEQGAEIWIKPYTSGNLPEPGDVVWRYRLTDDDGGGTVIV